MSIDGAPDERSDEIEITNFSSGTIDDDYFNQTMDGEAKIDSRVSELVLSRLALFNKLNLIVRERQDLSTRWEGLDPLTSREAIFYLMNYIPHDEVDELVLRRYANYISTDDRLVVDSEKMTAFN